MKQNRDVVRDLLLNEWDPIGVKDCPEARDEYDTYADKAYAMLVHDNASAEQIAQYLYRIETEHMGLGNSQQALSRAQHVARLLEAMRLQLKDK